MTLSERHTRTPCIGICSTTYGDLVCRGCKRYSHEIVQWNGYSETQRERVIARLEVLKAQAVEAFVQVIQPDRLHRSCRQVGIDPGKSEDPCSWAYSLLRTLCRAEGAPGGEAQFDMTLLPRELHEIGLSPRAPLNTLREAFDAIEDEFYRRSIAHFEHSFRARVDA